MWSSSLTLAGRRSPVAGKSYIAGAPGRAGGQDAILPYNYAEEALQIANRAGYRLHLADIHNFLVQ